MFRFDFQTLAAAFVLAVGVAVAPTANALVVVSDHFDDGVLDTAWSLSFVNATGWTATESGSALTVTGVMDPTDDVDWGIARLSRSFAALSDFRAEFDIAWSSATDDTAVMYLQAYLVDSDGARFAFAGYHDPWSRYSGGRIAWLAGTGSSFEGVFGVRNRNQSGSLSIDISRTGNQVDILWDSVTEISGIHGTPLVGIEIEFASYRFDGHRGWPEATFGTESLDRARVEGTPVVANQLSTLTVPEPVGMALFGLGLVTLGATRRRQMK